MYFRDRDMMWKKKKLCEIENSKIHIREIQRRGSGNIESKGEHALNKNRTITQGLEINLRTFEWIGLNSETNGEPLSMLSMKLDIIRFGGLERSCWLPCEKTLYFLRKEQIINRETKVSQQGVVVQFRMEEFFVNAGSFNVSEGSGVARLKTQWVGVEVGVQIKESMETLE